MSLMVHPRHLRSVPHTDGRRGLCMKGARAWFATNKLDWNDFVANGIPVERLRATGCVLCERVIAVAEAESTHGAVDGR